MQVLLLLMGLLVVAESGVAIGGPLASQVLALLEGCWLRVLHPARRWHADRVRQDMTT
jgi:hypothetical protein